MAPVSRPWGGTPHPGASRTPHSPPGKPGALWVRGLTRLRRLLKGPQASQTERQQRGRVGEQLALAYLRREGYVIEATNVRFPVGELDVVAREGNTLCFVEVRSRASERFGSARESITRDKRRHIVRAVRWYLQRRRVPWEGAVRFDVIAIQGRPDGPPIIELIRGAFRSDE